MLTVIIFASSKKEAQQMADDRQENLKFVRVHSRVSKGNSFYTFQQDEPEPQTALSKFIESVDLPQ